MKARAVIVDLDGTLYDSRERRDRCFPPGGKKDFHRWNAESHLDKPNLWCADLVQAIRAVGARPIFVTGRDEACRAFTQQWLRLYLNLQEGGNYLLFMRPTDDYRKDSDLKLEIYRREIEPYFDVWFCVDDRKQVVDMWRAQGLTCLQCDEGDF